MAANKSHLTDSSSSFSGSSSSKPPIGGTYLTDKHTLPTTVTYTPPEPSLWDKFVDKVPYTPPPVLGPPSELDTKPYKEDLFGRYVSDKDVSGSRVPRGTSRGSTSSAAPSVFESLLTPQTFDYLSTGEGYTPPTFSEPEPYVYGAEPYVYGQGLNTAGDSYNIWGTPVGAPNPYYHGQTGLFGTPTVTQEVDTSPTLGLPPVTLPEGVSPVPSAATPVRSSSGGKGILSDQIDPSLVAEIARRQAESDARLALPEVNPSIFGEPDNLFEVTPWEFDDSEIEYLLDEPGTIKEIGDVEDPLRWEVEKDARAAAEKVKSRDIRTSILDRIEEDRTAGETKAQNYHKKEVAGKFPMELSKAAEEKKLVKKKENTKKKEALRKKEEAKKDRFWWY